MATFVRSNFKSAKFFHLINFFSLLEHKKNERCFEFDINLQLFHIYSDEMVVRSFKLFPQATNIKCNLSFLFCLHKKLF